MPLKRTFIQIVNGNKIKTIPNISIERAADLLKDVQPLSDACVSGKLKTYHYNKYINDNIY